MGYFLHSTRKSLPALWRGDGLAGFRKNNGRAEVGELFLEILVAPEDVPGAVYGGCSLGDQPRHHQGRPAPQVRRLYDGAGEPARASYKRPVAAEKVYPGSHPVQLFRHLEPILVDVLRNNPGAGGLGEERDHLCLQVGGETGERQGGLRRPPRALRGRQRWPGPRSRCLAVRHPSRAASRTPS